MGNKLALDDFLTRIPKEYRGFVTLLEPYKGKRTKVSFLNKDCGHSKEYTLSSLIARKSFSKCKKCQHTLSLDSYLSKIDNKYHNNITIKDNFIGQNTFVEFKYHKCNCVISTTLKSLILQKQYDYCNKCLVKTSRKVVSGDSSAINLEEYLKRIPERYRSLVTLEGEYHGLATRIQYKNPKCDCISNISLGSLLQRKQFDICHSCSFISLKNIPEEYRKNIEFLEGSEILYTNPGCGCISRTTIDSLVCRNQFDFCNSCLTSSRKKSVSEYLKRIPEKYKNYVSYDADLGYKTIVKYKNPVCGCIQILKLSTLLQKDLDSYKCPKCGNGNYIQKDEIIKKISRYLDDVNIVSGYPGNRTTLVSGICKGCGAKVEDSYFKLNQYYTFYENQQCKSCMPRNFHQREILKYIESLGVKVTENDRSLIKFESNRFKELDIYCPDNMFGIEFNGLLWHSEKYQDDRNYHYKKTMACSELGIDLLHIWEDRYLKRKDIYKSIIKHKLGLTPNKVFARKTKIISLSKDEIKLFFDMNHLDGNVGCLKGWGLVYDNKIVQAISVRKVNKQNKKYNNYLEIARSATLIDYVVIGGESKLLSHIEKFAQEGLFSGILNYVSCEFGGRVKEKWKFRYEGVTDVSYCYTDGSGRISRQRLQKRRSGQSEKELAEELGLFRLNLTPNFVYVLRF